MINIKNIFFSEVRKIKNYKNILLSNKIIKSVLFLRYIFLIFITVFLIYLLIPKFFDEGKRYNYVKELLLENYDIKLENPSKITYKILPTPKIIIENLDSKFKFIRFKDFEDNPNIIDVEKGVKFFKDNDCDCILAIGGGSSIDMAKLIKFFAPKREPYLGKFNTKLEYNENVPLLAIPSTAGTGSEATQFAVLYVGLDKYSISDSLKESKSKLSMSYMSSNVLKRSVIFILYVHL